MIDNADILLDDVKSNSFCVYCLHLCESFLYAANLYPRYSGWLWIGTEIYVKGRQENHPADYCGHVRSRISDDEILAYI